MLKPYDGYKETNIPWLTEIPSHWSMLRNKNVLFEQKELVGDNATDYTLLSLTLNGVIARDMESGKGKFPKEFNSYKIVNKDNIIFCLFDVDETPRTVGLSKLEGMITGAYDVFEVKNINRDYLYYYYLSVDNAKDMKPLYTGLRKVIGIPKFLGTKLPVPLREEQDQIVKYLDWQTSKINTFIKAKKKQIELLKEQKQAIINKAVTKGLDDTVPMKDSGIEWLGEVPKHWEVNRLKRFCKINASITNLAKAYADNDELVFLPMENVSIDGKIDCSLKRPFKEIKSGYSSFAKHDVVIAKITPCFENGKGACLDELETEIGYGTTELITIRAYNNILPKYLYLVTMTQYFRLNGAEQMTGSAGQKRVPTDFLTNFIQGIPPLEEQKAIVTYLEEKTALIDKAIPVIEKEIELVSEYKTSLISSVVTGKVNVSNVVVPDFEVVEDEISEDEGLEVDMDDSN